VVLKSALLVPNGERVAEVAEERRSAQNRRVAEVQVKKVVEAPSPFLLKVTADPNLEVAAAAVKKVPSRRNVEAKAKAVVAGRRNPDQRSAEARARAAVGRKGQNRGPNVEAKVVVAGRKRPDQRSAEVKAKVGAAGRKSPSRNPPEVESLVAVLSQFPLNPTVDPNQKVEKAVVAGRRSGRRDQRNVRVAGRVARRKSGHRDQRGVRVAEVVAARKNGHRDRNERSLPRVAAGVPKNEAKSVPSPVAEARVKNLVVGHSLFQ